MKDRKKMEMVEMADASHRFSWWPCHITSVFVTRSDCQEGQVGILLLPGRSVWSLIRSGRTGVGAWHLFL